MGGECDACLFTRSAAARPGCLGSGAPEAGGGRPLRYQCAHDQPLRAPAGRSGERRGQADPRSPSTDPAGPGCCLDGPVGSAAGRDVAATLPPVGTDAGRAGEPGRDGACHPTAGLDTQKKALVAAEQDPDAREQWRDTIAEYNLEQFVFIDESSANITLTPRYARAPRGQRAPGSAPRNYQHNTTLVAALTPRGIQTPMTLEGAIDSDAFAAYVEQVLRTTLRPGQIVICDNLSVHKRADIRSAIEAAGCTLLFLPAYSPDFNPIEQAFSKLKAFLRRAEARTPEALEAAIGEALNTITATDARHWFAHAGYPLPSQPL